MIVSHRHKFVFIKTAKTAGTSIEIALAKLCGPEDIVTPIARPDERLRAGHGPRNYLRDHGLFGWKRLAAPFRRWTGERIGLDPAVDYYNHMPAAKVRAYLGDRVWTSYFKFAFERNPWDKHVSYFFWKTKQLPEAERPTFRDFVLRSDRRPLGWALYTIDDDIQVDFIGRFENLRDDLQTALARIGVSDAEPLANAKSGFRKDRHYRDMYDDETRAAVARYYAREIAAFEYEF